MYDAETAQLLGQLASEEPAPPQGLYGGLPPPIHQSPGLPVASPSPSPAAPAPAVHLDLQGENLFPGMELDDPKAKELVQLFKRHNLSETHQKVFLDKNVTTPLKYYKVGHDEKDCRTALRQSLLAFSS